MKPMSSANTWHMADWNLKRIIIHCGQSNAEFDMPMDFMRRQHQRIVELEEFID